MAAPVFPVALRLEGRSCLVVGGGRIAARKAEGLLECGAAVTIVAPEIGPEAAALAAWGVRLERRPYERGEVAGHWLAVAATDDPAVNHAVFVDGEAARVWVNAADDPANCSYTLPAVARSGDVTLAVSTAGASPALAQWLRDRCAAELATAGRMTRTLVHLRGAVRAAGRSTEGLPWRALIEDLAGDDARGDERAARRRAGEWIAALGLQQ